MRMHMHMMSRVGRRCGLVMRVSKRIIRSRFALEAI